MICAFRGYLRLRLTLVRDAARHIQHMHKALEQMNVKLVQVVEDIMGKTGLSLLRAIVAGERDPRQLAQKYRDPRCKRTAAEIALALQGNWRPEHLFALEQALEAWDFCQGQLRACDRKLKACLEALPKKRPAADFPPKPYERKHNNAPEFDIRPLLAQCAGVDLTAIEGIDSTVALVLLAEVGIDVSTFPTEKHFGSWLNLAPRAKGSGKRRRDRVGPGASRAASVLRIAAMNLQRSDSALGGFHRRLKGRLGAPKAITATAYKLARLVYRLLKYGHDYVSRGLAEYEAHFRERTIRALERKARAFGFELVPATLATPAPA
jgi:hypothetical protein